MDAKAQKVEALHYPAPRRGLSEYPPCLFLLLVFLSALLACDRKEPVKEQALRETRQQCIDHLTLTFKEKRLENIEYHLGPDWEYSDNRVETLYEKGFLFLLQKEATFKNKTDHNLAMVIRSIYSCSGVPPHLIVLQRTHFRIDERTDKVELVKTEVLEGGELVLAPTKEDQFFDALDRVDRMERRQKERDKEKGRRNE